MGYAINSQTGNFDHGFGITSPLDSTSYYFGAAQWTTGATTSVGARLTKLPYNVIITGASFAFNITGTLGSAEPVTFYLRVNGNDSVVSSSVLMDAAVNSFIASGLNIPIPAGTTFESKFTAPNFATNPTNVICIVTYFFDRA